MKGIMTNTTGVEDSITEIRYKLNLSDMITIPVSYFPNQPNHQVQYIHQLFLKIRERILIHSFIIFLQVLDLLGPKNEADLAPVPKTDKKAVKPAKVEKVKTEAMGNPF